MPVFRFTAGIFSGLFRSGDCQKDFAAGSACRLCPGGSTSGKKENPAGKIDGEAAKITGLDRAVRCGNQNRENV